MTKNTISKGSDKDWQITTKRFVTYIDIMGFKDMIARTPHSDVYNMMKRIEKKYKFYENMKWKDIGSNHVKSTTYSDSIILYSENESIESLKSIIRSTAGLINDLFVEGVPHKGAFAFGKMTLDTTNSIFFGQPLIDAYLLQQELHYYGIIIHATAEQKMEEIVNLKKLHFIFNYPCPLKKTTSNHLTIRPMYAFNTGNTYKKENEELFKSIKKMRQMTSGYLRKYIDNTELYLKNQK